MMNDLPRFNSRLIFVGALLLVVVFMFIFLVMVQSARSDVPFPSSDSETIPYDMEGNEAPPNSGASEETENIDSSVKCGLEKPGLGTLTKEQVGRMTWGYLHTTLANLKIDSFTDEQEQKNMTDKAVKLVHTTTELFPCPICKEHFSNVLRENPYHKFAAEKSQDMKPSVSLSHWLCMLHNIVNVKLKKKLFPCTDEDLERRWKMGAKRC